MFLKYKIQIYYFFLIFLSISFPIYYGNIGVFPIDSFLIFNGGYNVFNGYHPFKDYWSITGPILDYFQSIFFLIFGINWLSYILHASVINSLLVVISFYFFLQNEIKRRALIFILSFNRDLSLFTNRYSIYGLSRIYLFIYFNNIFAIRIAI